MQAGIDPIPALCATRRKCLFIKPDATAQFQVTLNYNRLLTKVTAAISPVKLALERCFDYRHNFFKRKPPRYLLQKVGRF